MGPHTGRGVDWGLGSSMHLGVAIGMVGDWVTGQVEDQVAPCVLDWVREHGRNQAVVCMQEQVAAWV